MSSGTKDIECTANCGPFPKHKGSKSDIGTGFDFGIPWRSIQLDKTYFTPAFFNFL